MAQPPDGARHRAGPDRRLAAGGGVLETELLQAQLSAIDAWQAARAERYAAALALLADETTRADAASRLERLARQQQALRDRADLPAPPQRPRRGALRTVLVGHDATDLLSPRADLDVLAHLLDLDSAVGVCVAEQPDAVVLGLDLPVLAVAEAATDLATFCPDSRVVGYGGSRAAARMLVDTGALPLVCPAGTPPEVVVASVRSSRRVAG